MIKIENLIWGKLVISKKKYWQVLIINQRVFPREVEKTKKELGTDHLLSQEEKKKLLSQSPEIILIANGWNGILKVDKDFKKETLKKGIDLEILETPKAVIRFNYLQDSGKRVNALIHTTC